MSEEKQKRIVFVCTGNTCRSPMAEALLCSEVKRLRKNVVVSSAGVNVQKGDTLNEKSARVLTENGLTLFNFSPKQMTKQTLLEADVILCMTARQRDYLREVYRHYIADNKQDEKILSLFDVVGYDIPDPYGKGEDAYRETFEKLSKAMEEIVRRFIGETQEKAPIKEGEELIKVEQKTPKKRGRKPGQKNGTGKKATAKKTSQKTGEKTKKTSKKTKKNA